eukprot:TRINITY_DN11162_c2_g2_i1.p1 TRINITY_DN11162_c2_g2~~TRINITY_DN11162_c2_g2_i1.p1  ORF type:complete len:364 (+),score=57.05 TRINITY_DN11162_c2_g2_i1:52-1143(+)
MSRYLASGSSGLMQNLYGNVATVFGGYGTVGLGISHELAKSGTMLILPYHRSYSDPRQAQLCSPEPWNYQIMNTDFNKPAQLREMCEPSDYVVVSLGRNVRPNTPLRWRDLNWGYDAIYRQLPVDIAKICAEQKKETMVFISAIGADVDSDSPVLRAKGRAEIEIREHMPSAIIIRPSDVFSRQGCHYNCFLRSLAKRMVMQSVVVYPEMLSRVSYPVFAYDIGSAVTHALQDPACHGKTFELGGRQRITYGEAVKFVSSVTRAPPETFRIPYTAAKAWGTLTELTRWHSAQPKDWYVRMQYNAIPNEHELADIYGWEDLGVDKRNLILMEEVAKDALANFTSTGKTHSLNGGRSSHDAFYLW